MARTATIRVASFKFAVPMDPARLPRDLVPADGPPGEPVIELVLEGGSLAVRARVNGRNYRKMLKQIDEHGAGNMAVVLQGVLRAAASSGGPLELEGAGFQAVVKVPKGVPGPMAPEGGP